MIKNTRHILKYLQMLLIALVLLPFGAWAQFTLNGTTITQTGGTEAAPMDFDDAIAAINDTNIIEKAGNTFIIKSGAHLSQSGWIEIKDHEHVIMEGGNRWGRYSGGGLIMRPYSEVSFLGAHTGNDRSDNTFRNGFTFIAEIYDLGDGNIIKPTWRTARTGRDDNFASLIGQNSVYKIDGLTLILDNNISIKLYEDTGSYVNNFHVKANASIPNINVQFRNREVREYIYEDWTFEGVNYLSNYQSVAGASNTFVRPKFVYDSDFDIRTSYFHNNIPIKIVDMIMGGTGNFTGRYYRLGQQAVEFKEYTTDKTTFLQGATKLQDVSVFYESTDATNAPTISETSNVDGEVEVELLKRYKPLGTVDLTPTVIQWKASAGKYDKTTFPNYEVFSQSERESRNENTIQLGDDENLTETNSATVAAYTTIDDLDELYDYAKYWKTLNADNIIVPNGADALISANGRELDLGTFNLVVDSAAGSVFAVDTGNNTITIKSTALLSSSKFDYIETSGTITTANGATLEHGYIDSTGTNKFVHLDWNTPTSHNVIIENLQDNSNIVGPILATESYKGHFLMPNPVPTNGIRLTIETTNIGFSLFEELIPEADISFIRTNINLNANEERQVQMLYLMRKIFQKAEAINGALSGTTPNTNVSINFTSSSAEATNENQAAILELLRLVLVKISANRAAFEE